MPGWTRSFRARSFHALTGFLLGAAGLATLSWESVSFGHAHRAGGLAAHHSHVHLGEHEHSGPAAGHRHPEAPPEAPDPHERDEPKRKTSSSSFSVAPALFQPVDAGTPEVHLADAAPLAPALAVPLVVRAAARLTPPRAPPSPLAAPHPLD